MQEQQSAGATAKERREQSLRAIAETLQVARETATELSTQSEQLGRSERRLDDAQHTVDQSKRVLRGMTWSGWLFNAVTSGPKRTEQLPSTNSSQTKAIAVGFICPECRVQYQSQSQLAHHYDTAHQSIAEEKTEPDTPSFQPLPQNARSQPSTDKTSKEVAEEQYETLREQDRFLDELSPQLEELKHSSMAIGDALTSQNEHLETIESKSERLNRETQRLSVRTKEMSSKWLQVDLLMRCALQEVGSGRFLCEWNGLPILKPEVVQDHCKFRAYTLGGDAELFGLQSEVTKMFFGINRFGYLRIQGKGLYSYERLWIDQSRETTPILCLASFFGIGGWVTKKSEEADGSAKLTLIRGTEENKEKALQFKIVVLKDSDDFQSKK